MDMDEFFADDSNAQNNVNGDGVLGGDTTAQDDFGFMAETNPHEATNNDNVETDMGNNTGDNNNNEDNGGIFGAIMGDNTNEEETTNNDNENRNEEQKEEQKEDPTEKSDAEPTFLSVWQEERRQELEKRRQTEVEQQKKLLEEAQNDLENYHSERAKRIEAKKKENRLKETNLREDLQSTFEHGTIWEQVGKMVNLQEVKSKKDGHDRMRVLLIGLKNAKQ